MLDRILSYDDNKGLGSTEGIVRDNVPVQSAFKLLIQPLVKSVSWKDYQCLIKN